MRRAKSLFRAVLKTTSERPYLLSAASFFESVIKDILISFFEEGTKDSELTMSFIRNRAIEREYHKFFAWRDTNANTFFGLFGGGFKDFMKGEVKKDKQLDDSIKAFLKLGDSRNELVHENFTVFPLQTTAEEIYELYKRASPFIDVLPVKLREYGNSAGSESGEAGQKS